SCIVGLEFLSNLACAWWSRRGGRASEALLVGVMSFDVILLSALLYFTGGPFNPFSFLYLVEIALGAVVLRERWTWALVVLALFCSGVLFLAHHELPLGESMHAEHTASSLSIHLYGMWVAFGVAAAFIVYFLMRVTRALAAQEALLQDAQRRTARNEKLASLATLAAGAGRQRSFRSGRAAAHPGRDRCAGTGDAGGAAAARGGACAARHRQKCAGRLARRPRGGGARAHQRRGGANRGAGSGQRHAARRAGRRRRAVFHDQPSRPRHGARPVSDP